HYPDVLLIDNRTVQNIFLLVRQAIEDLVGNADGLFPARRVKKACSKDFVVDELNTGTGTREGVDSHKTNILIGKDVFANRMSAVGHDVVMCEHQVEGLKIANALSDLRLGCVQFSFPGHFSS